MLALPGLLLLAPGLEAARLRWRIAPWALWLFAAAGLWFAISGTGFLFYLYRRTVQDKQKFQWADKSEQLPPADLKA